MAEACGLGVVVYSPLAGGLLTGKYRRGEQGRLTTGGAGGEAATQRTAVLDAGLAIADELGTTPARVSLAWLRRRAADAQTSMTPIVGPRTPAHLKEYLGALEVELGDQHYQRLAEVSAIQLGAPHEDVASALSHGADGNRRLLDPRASPGPGRWPGRRTSGSPGEPVPIARIAAINLECADPADLARFWGRHARWRGHGPDSRLLRREGRHHLPRSPSTPTTTSHRPGPRPSGPSNFTSTSPSMTSGGIRRPGRPARRPWSAVPRRSLRRPTGAGASSVHDAPRPRRSR
jgi:hypothetical protein